MSTYTVTATREGHWWLLEAPDIGAYGQAKSLAEAPEAARDIIALALDIDPEGISVTIDPRPDEATAAAMARADELATDADETKTEAARLRSEAVRTFVEEHHLPYREAAQALRMSSQRVHQLVRATDTTDTTV